MPQPGNEKLFLNNWNVKNYPGFPERSGPNHFFQWDVQLPNEKKVFMSISVAVFAWRPFFGSISEKRDTSVSETRTSQKKKVVKTSMVNESDVLFSLRIKFFSVCHGSVRKIAIRNCRLNRRGGVSFFFV